jgi:hypothetical protein
MQGDFSLALASSLPESLEKWRDGGLSKEVSTCGN